MLYPRNLLLKANLLYTLKNIIFCFKVCSFLANNVVDYSYKMLFLSNLQIRYLDLTISFLQIEEKNISCE